MKQHSDLSGKVALVTGGSGGIGQVVCTSLAKLGARVAISSHDGRKATAVADSLKSNGHDAYATDFEVTSVADTHRMVDEVAKHFGCLDILVNCIGTQREEKAVDVTEENFDYILDVNLKGTMFQAQAAARHMIRQGTGGKQIHFGSVRGLLALPGRGYSGYCAAKAGVSAICKQLATEWAAHKINVNVIAPTFIRTPQAERWLSDPEFYSKLVARIPLGRIGEPEDVAGVAVFLASKASDFITGQTLYLDGGLTASQ